MEWGVVTDVHIMISIDVIDLYNKLDTLEVKIWIDGGWGVDALLGKQTRPHEDLDIAIQQKDVSELCKLLETEGYKEVKRDNQWNFVLGDPKGRKVDLHAFVLDDLGNVVEGIPYPSASLTGRGSINGRNVRCISPEYQIKFHSGYELRDKDFKDVSALCNHFGIDYPEEYRHLKKQD
jgi:lincosamide nucleotidyltransferase A/C/D/E